MRGGMQRSLRLWILFLALIPGGCVPAPKPGSTELPPGVERLPGVYQDINPRWSHDGKRIAFLRATTDRHLQLHLVDARLSRPIALLEDEPVSPDRGYHSQWQRYCSPDTLAWSPDDRQIAFERIEWFTFEDGERLPGTGLWSLSLRSGRVLPLALHPPRYESRFYYFHDPVWSPDGRYLAFVGESINGNRALFVHPLKGQKSQEVTPRFDQYEECDWPAWRPGIVADHARPVPPVLAFRQGIVHPFAAPPTETVRLLHPGLPCLAPETEPFRLRSRDYASLLPQRDPTQPVAARVGHLLWSPDGRRLAFTLTPDANDFERYELWAVAVDGKTGSATRRVSPHDGHGYLAPVWIGNDRLGALSPDGTDFDVITLDLATGHKRTLGTIESADCDWSPDRTRIVYTGPPAEDGDEAPTTLRLFDTALRAARR